MICEFCKNKFSSTSNLLSHQRTAKYCLDKQNKEIDNKFTCDACKSSFTRKQDYNRHVNICKSILPFEIITENNQLKEKMNDLKQTIEEQKQTIKELQDKLENVAIHAVSRPTTTKNTQINNYIQKLEPITDDILKDNVPNLTIQHILKGPEGYAEYALEFPLKNRVICVDYARRKVKFKDPTGNVITDPEMSNVATKFFNSIKDKNKELIIQYGTEMRERFGDELDTIVNLLDYKINVENGADGSKTDFYHDFVRNICNKTIIE